MTLFCCSIIVVEIGEDVPALDCLILLVSRGPLSMSIPLDNISSSNWPCPVAEQPSNPKKLATKTTESLADMLLCCNHMAIFTLDSLILV